MDTKFEWDENKNRINIEKHGISFSTAQRIFENPVWSWHDNRYDYGENRFISIGVVDGLEVLTVVHTDRNGRKRLISARFASQKERTLYYEKIR